MDQDLGIERRTSQKGQAGFDASEFSKERRAGVFISPFPFPPVGRPGREPWLGSMESGAAKGSRHRLPRACNRGPGKQSAPSQAILTLKK
jgi:hypothetical protein